MVSRHGFRATITVQGTLAAQGKMRQDRNLHPGVGIPVLRFRTPVPRFLQRLIAGKNADYQPAAVRRFIERLADRRHHTGSASGQQVNSTLRQPPTQGRGTLNIGSTTGSHHSDDGQAGHGRRHGTQHSTPAARGASVAPGQFPRFPLSQFPRKLGSRSSRVLDRPVVANYLRRSAYT